MTDLRARLEAAGLPSEEAIAATRCVEAIGINHVGAYIIDAKAIARVVVAARLAELADKEGDMMFDYNDYKSNDNGYEQMTVWIEAKALLARLFPETP